MTEKKKLAAGPQSIESMNCIDDEDLADKICTKVWKNQIHGLGNGPVGITEVTLRKHAIPGWYAIGDFAINGDFRPWYDIYVNSEEKLTFLKQKLKSICFENSIHSIYEND